MATPALLAADRCVPPDVQVIDESDLSAAAEDELHFSYDIPAGTSNLTFLLLLPEGNADLFVAFDRQPTISDFDCSSTNPGNATEFCVIANPQGGTHFVTIHAVTDFSDAVLHVSYRPPPPPVCGNGTLEQGEQCDDGNTEDGDGCSAMCELEGSVLQLVAADAHACALRADQRVSCWGENANGELGNGSFDFPTDGRIGPELVRVSPEEALSDARHIAANGRSTCAVRDDGTVWCWGWNASQVTDPHELGHARFATLITDPDGVPVTGASKVALTRNAACVLKFDGTVWCWGERVTEGLFWHDHGNPVRPTRIEQTDGDEWGGVVSEFEGVADISGGDVFCGVKLDQTVWCWGDRQWPTLRQRVLGIASQVEGSLVSIREGESWICGIDENDKAKCMGWYQRLRFLSLSGNPTVLDVSGDCLLLEDGAVHCPWDDVDTARHHGCGPSNAEFLPASSDSCPNCKTPSNFLGLAGGAQHIASSDTMTCALTTDREDVWCWGYHHEVYEPFPGDPEYVCVPRDHPERIVLD